MIGILINKLRARQILMGRSLWWQVRVQKNMDSRNTLCYLGVSMRREYFMFGYNESVVNSVSIPHTKLHKRHITLSFHRVRETIAAGVMPFEFLPGKENPADSLPKHWGYQQVWKILQPILFWREDTMDLISNQDKNRTKGGEINDSSILHRFKKIIS